MLEVAGHGLKPDLAQHGSNRGTGDGWGGCRTSRTWRRAVWVAGSVGWWRCVGRGGCVEWWRAAGIGPGKGRMALGALRGIGGLRMRGTGEGEKAQEKKRHGNGSAQGREQGGLGAERGCNSVLNRDCICAEVLAACGEDGVMVSRLESVEWTPGQHALRWSPRFLAHRMPRQRSRRRLG